MIQSKKVTDQPMLQELRAFLQSNHLPYSDTQLATSHYLLFYENDELIGSVGIEWYQSNALLRSLAVAEKWRGQGLGRKMVTEIMKQAQNEKMEGVFLLTETAAPFFLQLGFSDFDREKAPEGIRSSSEFSHVCPASARFMFTPISTIIRTL